ncbi:hypothetical protein CHCC20335_2571 [Bacillus paralicheniformis]|nr:hypothetical protein CHCC20335_2571 [Bacillus paralicheniformis]
MSNRPEKTSTAIIIFLYMLMIPFSLISLLAASRRFFFKKTPDRFFLDQVP